MKPTRTDTLVGSFVLVGLVAVAYLALHLGAGNLPSGDTYLIEARFSNAGGLNRGASVLLAGVIVGRVEDIRLDPGDFSAIATLRVRSNVHLPTDSMASIRTSGLIGDRFISLAPGAEADNLTPGSRIVLTESAVDLESLIGKMAFGSVDKETPPNETQESPQ